MKKILFLMAFIFIMPLCLISQTLDQSNTTGSGIDSGANSANPHGQSFTAGVTGNLSQVSLRLGDIGGYFSPGTFQLRIFEGNGYSGNILNTTLVDILTTTTGSTNEFPVVLSSLVPITAGNMYTIDFRGLGSAAISFRLLFSGYANGGYYFGNGDTGLYNTYDLWFKTFVAPPLVPATHLNFDGIDDRANTNNSSLPFGNSARTIEAWVKTNTTVTGTIVNYGNQTNNQRFGLLVTGTGEFYVVGENNDFNTGQVINDNNWHHVAAVFDGALLTVYIDGVNVGSTTKTYATNGDLLSLGATYRTTFWGEHLNGNIDEARIWNRAKSQSEIQGQMNCELIGNETGLVSYYKLNQGNDAVNNATVTSALDSSPSSNDAVLNNMSLNGTTSNWLAGSPITTGSVVPSIPTATTAVTYAQGDTASPLTATTGTNGTGLLWYTTATGGTGSTTAPTPSTATVGNTSYYVSSTNANGCESERLEIVVTVNAATPATHLNFDGVNDYVTLTHYERPETMTIEAMIKTSSFGQEQIIGWAHPTNAFTAEFKLDQNKLTYGEWNQSLGSFLKVESSIIINDNNWHHVAAVRNGNGINNVTLYVDGVSVGSGTVNHTIASQTLNIGAYSNATTDQFFNGDIEELRVWNIALSQTEIQNRTSCELQGNETGLISYYKFNQGNDGANNSMETTLTDITSNTNNGNLQGFALSGLSSNWLAGSPITTGSTCSTLSAEVFSQELEFNIYPNPTKNTVQDKLKSNTKAEIDIYDLNGRLIKKQSIQSNGMVDMSSFANGVYLFKISLNNNVVTKRIIKH